MNKESSPKLFHHEPSKPEPEYINLEKNMTFSDRPGTLQYFFPEKQITNREVQDNSLKYQPTKPVFALLHKAVEQFKRILIYSSKSQLTERNALFLNDTTYFPEHKESFPRVHNRFMRGFLIKGTSFLHWLNKFPVFDPYENTRVVWEVVNLISIIFFLFRLPYEVGFKDFISEGWCVFFFVLFLIDMFVNVNSAYLINGYLIKDRKTIAKHYLSNFFILDAISIICFLVPRPTPQADYVNTVYFVTQWLFFLRIRNLKIYYARFLERIYSKFNIRDSYIDLINLVSFNLFVIQIFACIWHLLAIEKKLQSGDAEDTWLVYYGLATKSTRVQYIYSLYWSTVTVMTVGYGDISPQNTTEIVFVMISVLIGCLVVAYVISSIGGIVNEFDKESQTFKQNLYVMNKFMNRKAISPNLQMKVRQYLKFIWQEELTQDSEMESAIIDKLSKTLKEEIFTEANGYFLLNSPMFYSNFSETTIRELMHHVKEARFNPGETIFAENEVDDCALYFLLKGNVQICTNSLNRYHKNVKLTLATISEGAMFGEMAFFSGQIRTVSASSKDFTSLLYLKREDFIKTLKRFPIDYERFCQIKDQLLLGNNFRSINLKCFACKQFDHLGINCPLLHYNKDFYLQKKVVIENDWQKRRKFKRKKNKPLNSLAFNRLIQKMSLDFHGRGFVESPLHRVNVVRDFYSENMEEFKEEGHDNMQEYHGNDDYNNNKYQRSPQLLRLMVPRRSQEQESYDMREYDYPSPHLRKSPLFWKDFEKVTHFNFYFPSGNIQTPEQKIIEKKDRQNKTKQKFQAFFLKKTRESMRIDEDFIRNNQKLFDFQRIFNLRTRYTVDAHKQQIFSSREQSNMSFYDVAYEVLTNEKLRKKLTNMKDRAIKIKKIRNKRKFIE